jgi:hypothetical protein
MARVSAWRFSSENDLIGLLITKSTSSVSSSVITPVPGPPLPGPEKDGRSPTKSRFPSGPRTEPSSPARRGGNTALAPIAGLVIRGWLVSRRNRSVYSGFVPTS